MYGTDYPGLLKHQGPINFKSIADSCPLHWAEFKWASQPQSMKQLCTWALNQRDVFTSIMGNHGKKKLPSSEVAPPAENSGSPPMGEVRRLFHCIQMLDHFTVLPILSPSIPLNFLSAGSMLNPGICWTSSSVALQTQCPASAPSIGQFHQNPLGMIHDTSRCHFSKRATSPRNVKRLHQL